MVIHAPSGETAGLLSLKQRRDRAVFVEHHEADVQGPRSGRGLDGPAGEHEHAPGHADGPTTYAASIASMRPARSRPVAAGCCDGIQRIVALASLLR